MTKRISVLSHFLNNFPTSFLFTMKTAALRSFSKINSDVLQNSRRLFSYKFEMTPASRAAETQEEAKPPAATDDQLKVPKPNFRYNVCQPRTSPVEKPNNVGDIVGAHKQTVKAAIEEQHLQPSMLPEYYQNHMEKNALIHPEPELTENDRINNGPNPIVQRRFQVSKTHANAVFPLKSVKLANPFPEPVKMMMSRTVADDEKAEQMLAESKSQRSFNVNKNNFRSFSTEVKRWYSKTVSSNPDKCKKLGKTGAKGCPKMHLAKCPPRARQKCDRLAKQIDCKKQEAPYPAYSEFCHEEIEEKPSSCKLCPWKPEDNPNFKPQKKKLHTSSQLSVRRSGLEVESTNEEIKLEESPPVAEEAFEEGMLCDLRKPDCERPKNRRCPEKKSEKKKPEKKKPKKPETKCVNEILEEDVLLSPESAQNLLSLRGKDSKKTPGGPCKIKKFKFPSCEKPKRKEKVHEGPCPPKRKKPKVPDCPPDEDGKCGFTSEVVNEGYSLSQGGRRNDKERKCPKIDMTTHKEEDEDDDPCKLKRKGTTKICPGDLLKKKRRKPRKPYQKRTSAVVPPVESKNEPPQPVKRI